MKNSLLRLYVENKKYWLGLGIVLFMSMLAGYFKMQASIFWGEAVDFGVVGNIYGMLVSAGLMAGIVLLDCIRTALHYYIIGVVTEGMFVDLRNRAFQKIVKGDVAVLESKFSTGDTATRLNSDMDSMSNFVAGHVSNFSRLIFQGIFAIIGCLFLSWQLSIAYFIVLPLTLWLVKNISKPIQKQSKKSMDERGSAVGTAVEAISGIFTVKAFGMEEILAQRFNKAADNACGQKIKSEKIGMKMTGVKYVANVVQIITLFGVGSFLVSNGMLQMGTMIAFISLSNYISEPFGQMDYMMRTVREAVATVQRFYEVLETPNEQEGKITKAKTDVPCVSEGLEFSYSQENAILNDVHIKIGCKQRVAVIGESGCGKSTLIKLICRFYLPQKGSLKLFGVEATDWETTALRQNLALVTQDAYLFDGSIYENIAYGYPGLTRKECKTVLQEVGLWTLVCGFDDGMDHQIGEYGFQLSGGQKQRLCIARAMVNKASLVLLDEATSALDTQTEKEVQMALQKLLEGRSAVIVAHRLTTVQDADYIYCMEKGRVLEEGNPTYLLAKKGRYYEMCRQQGLLEENI